MTEFLFAAKHLAVIGLLVFVSYVLGRRLLWSLPFRSTGEQVAFSASVGLGLIGTALFLLGLVHLLHVGVVAALVLATLAACSRVFVEMGAALRRGGRALTTRGTRSRAAVRLAAGILAFAGMAWLAVLALYPPHLWDAISYHLAAAKIFAVEQVVRPAENLRYCVAPQLNEVLFALMLMVSDDLSAQLVQFAAMVLVAVLLAGWCGARYPPLAGPVAAGLWLGSPLVLALGTNAYIDMGVAFFCTMAVFAFVNGLEEPGAHWMRVAGLSAGFAAGTKYTALVTVAILGTLLLIRAVRSRAWRAVAEFSICCALVAGPWYAYTFAHTGNPVSPYLSSVFPDRGCWDQRDAATVGQDMAQHGGPRTLAGLLALPASVTDDRLPFGGPLALSKTAAFALPLFLVGALRDRRTRVLGVFALVSFLFWFFSVQITRYMLAAVPAMCALAVIAADWGLRSLLRRIPAAVASAMAFFGGAALVIPAWETVHEVRRWGPPPMTARERVLYHERVPSYRCAKWLNDHLGRNYRVLTYTHEYMTYYFDGERIGDGLGRMRYVDIPFEDARSLRAWLKGAEASYLLLTHPPFRVESEPFFQQHFQLQCGSADTRLYRVADSGVPATELGPELVVNGDFGYQGDWEWYGSAAYKPEHGRGNPAGRVGSAGYPHQRIAVLPDQLHRLSFRMRCNSVTKPQVYLRWYDREGAVVGHEAPFLECRPPGRKVDVPILSPLTAVEVHLLVLPGIADSWFDDLSLRAVVERAPPGREPRRVELPARPMVRGLRVEPLADGLAIDIRETASMLEMAIPRTVVEPGQRAQVELDLKTGAPGPFAVRFIRLDGTVSRRAFFEPGAEPGSGERRVRFRVLSPKDFSGDAVRLRIHPPQAAASGSFELANLAVGVVARDGP